ncbi:lysozyme [Hymenobacter sp. BT186]|uniref:Lysozyme n=1 Tax=Hymenobacter telluris TaxID=2816474 RepID=A0A939EW72_9BACT|nr:lysozyme [Hymenobacter telluris]MBO0358635.1 lysozyme [Hymenobacter telluris]MBW3374661.1 lysozyme [Hymenobacter norwichensis]
MDQKPNKKSPGPAVAAIFGAALLLAVPFIVDKEGESLTAYRDVAGVWTICHGETLGVKPGDVKTKEACRLMTHSRVGHFMTQVDNAVTLDISPATLAAHTSFAYNIGINGYRNSQALKLTNAGRLKDGCQAMMNWYTAGGKDCRKRANKCYGLIARRAAERDMCLKGVQ